MKEFKVLFGKRIKEIRTSKKITQEKLAEKIGVEQKSISCIEKGITFPSQYLLKLSEALEVSVSELLDFEHHKYNILEMKQYIIQTLDIIPDNDVKILFRVAKSMR